LAALARLADAPRAAKELFTPRQLPATASVGAPIRPAGRPLAYFPHVVATRPRPILRAKKRRVHPLIVFPPDHRQVFNDRSYPWCTIGKVVTGRGWGTGTLVGPRHMVTASHVIDWQPDNAGSIHFQLAYFDGNALDDAWGEVVRAYRHEGPSPDGEFEVAEDYVVVRLSKRLGDQFGAMGWKTYTDSWDGNSNFWQVGYPGDVGGGERPSFQSGVSFEDADAPGFFNQGDGLDMETEASVNHGDSGGPFFGWWDDGPYVVGVVSAEGALDSTLEDPTRGLDSDNWGAGGAPLSALIKSAHDDWP
jgi:V8-like Glu-specific endopeptidase